MPVLAYSDNSVQSLHPRYRFFYDQYELIRDVIAGETRVKFRKQKYLPMPDGDSGDIDRYKNYLKRAVFYNVSRKTLAGLVAQIYKDDPQINLPTQMEVLEDNVDGGGVGLIQQSKKALSHTLSYSRCGLFIDYSRPKNEEESDEPVTRQQVENNEARPVIKLYDGAQIINWRLTKTGGPEKLSLVVIYEPYDSSTEDDFETRKSPQYRVLRLTDGVYTHQIYRETTPSKLRDDENILPKKGTYVPGELTTPRDSAGNPLDHIPFTFIGSENNDSSPDEPFFYDLASLNLAHYRNSADYEESCFVVGQPTIAAIGITENWLKEVLNGKIKFGSRGGIALPAGGDIKLVQASENTMIAEAMDKKEKQMVALGAQIVQDRDVQRTATETRHDATSQGSILASSAQNVQSAYMWALGECGLFTGEEIEDDAFIVDMDFELANMSVEEVRSVIEQWVKSAITFSEMRTRLRKSGSATLDDEIAKNEITAEADERAERAMKLAQSQQPQPQPGQPNNEND